MINTRTWTQRTFRMTQFDKKYKKMHKKILTKDKYPKLRSRSIIRHFWLLLVFKNAYWRCTESFFFIIICNNYKYIWLSFRKNKNSHSYYVLSTVTFYLFFYFVLPVFCVECFEHRLSAYPKKKYMNEHCKISCVKYDTSLALLRSMGWSSSSRRVALEFIEN